MIKCVDKLLYKGSYFWEGFSVGFVFIYMKGYCVGDILVYHYCTPSSKCSGHTVRCSEHCRPTAKQYSAPTVWVVHTLFCFAWHPYGKLGLFKTKLVIGEVSV